MKKIKIENLSLGSTSPFCVCTSVYSEKELITLMNLKPSTRYRVRVQLSRSGEGGEGEPGPDAIMETDCPGRCSNNSEFG